MFKVSDYFICKDRRTFFIGRVNRVVTDLKSTTVTYYFTNVHGDKRFNTWFQSNSYTESICTNLGNKCKKETLISLYAPMGTKDEV